MNLPSQRSGTPRLSALLLRALVCLKSIKSLLRSAAFHPRKMKSEYVYKKIKRRVTLWEPSLFVRSVWDFFVCFVGCKPLSRTHIIILKERTEKSVHWFTSFAFCREDQGYSEISDQSKTVWYMFVVTAFRFSLADTFEQNDSKRSAFIFHVHERCRITLHWCTSVSSSVNDSLIEPFISVFKPRICPVCAWHLNPGPQL